MELSCGPYERQLKEAHKARVARMNAASWELKRQKSVENENSELIRNLRVQVQLWKAKYRALAEELKKVSAENIARDVVSSDLNATQIKNLICKRYGIEKERFEAHRRTREIVFPRQIAMHLCVKHLRLSLPDIGRRFNGRDHTTVLHANRKIERLRATNPKLDAEIRELESELGCI